MTAITRSDVGLATLTPGPECSISGYSAGEALAAGDAVYIKTSDGKIYKSKGLGLSAPAAPALTTATTGGTVAAGFHGVKITYKNASGETLASEPAYIITTGATSTITVTSPAAAGSGGNAATHFLVYMTPPNGGPFKLQNGTGTAVGSNFTLTAPAVTNTAEAPTSNSTGAVVARVDGFVTKDYLSGRACTIFSDVELNYGASLSPGTLLYLDDTTAGALNDAKTALGTVPVAIITSSKTVFVKRSY